MCEGFGAATSMTHLVVRRETLDLAFTIPSCMMAFPSLREENEAFIECALDPNHSK